MITAALAAILAAAATCTRASTSLSRWALAQLAGIRPPAGRTPARAASSALLVALALPAGAAAVIIPLSPHDSAAPAAAVYGTGSAEIMLQQQQLHAVYTRRADHAAHIAHVRWVRHVRAVRAARRAAAAAAAAALAAQQAAAQQAAQAASAPPAPTPAPPPPAPVSAPPPAGGGGDPRAYALSLVGSAQFGCVDAIFTRESGWNVYAQNPYSGAYGIPQALPGSKMASAGADWATNADTQVRWGIS